ncbi:S-formylglutathione hydrolase [Rhodopseudomonas julia]|uniref:S-formylglutathione hydrolase n=1 Tax=Rhodopseudomonas julia TaxID=200617 RepID=A0ABU0CB93_9BRAD|nr:S-formylglutathione hydrolase [Rhodopseudomonas julia]
METISTWAAHGGTQGVYSHASEATGTEMTFAVFVPPQAKVAPCPIVTYLSGLTCTHANVMEKGEYRRAAAEHGLIVVCPDTSPRGEGVADDDAYDMGQGAGFYLDATEEPWAQHFRMESYVRDELPAVIAANFPVDTERQSILGHSMGGHGALTLALKNPGRYRACSAFAPIVAPIEVPWGQKALPTYLGSDEQSWRPYDACALIADGARFSEFLVDQGTGDNFLAEQLRPELFEKACAAGGIPLTLRMQPGYDHSYYFISTFMEDHLTWHAKRLKG